MKRYTVSRLAELSGVSVRALHHYDAIGLLRAAYHGGNGYRYYEEAELLRLQQILLRLLLHRELGIPLGRIAAILDDPGFDRLAALREQRGRLAAEAVRYAELAQTIDRTIASLSGETHMSNADLYRGISPTRQAEYEAWLVEQFGGDIPMHIATSRKSYDVLSEQEKAARQQELADIENAWADAMKNGILANSPALDPLLARHRAWIAAMWNRPCSPGAYHGLADLQLSHPDFVARHEGIATGFADYRADAMKAFARRVAA